MEKELIYGWLKDSMDNMIFDGPEELHIEIGQPGTAPYYRTNLYIKDVIEHLQQEPWTKEEPIPQPLLDDIYEEAELELYDDFHNCGGSVLNRIWDIHCIYHHMDEEHQDKLLIFIADEIDTELRYVIQASKGE